MSEKRGIDMKSDFYILFKTYKGKQIIKQQQLAKETGNYETEHVETSEIEQKPLLKFNEFNDEEKLEMKEIYREKNRKQKGKFIEKKKLQRQLKNLSKIK